MKFNPTLFETLLLLFLNLLVFIYARHSKRFWRWRENWNKKRRSILQLKPREPKDCPLCNILLTILPRRAHPDVTPWNQIKSPAGRPKKYDLSGFACLNPFCTYFGITDPAIHAIVRNGIRGVGKDIPSIHCQACGKSKTSRLGTPLYQLKTPVARIAMVMHTLSEGVDIAAASRIFSHHPSTLRRWLDRSGLHSARLHERLFFRSVNEGHLQLDELVTKVKHPNDKLWLWTAVAASSKLILAFHLGGRATEDACRLTHQIRQRLSPDTWPIFTSDGLNQYFYGLTAHFGSWLKPPRARKHHWFPDARLQYAQLRKNRAGSKIKFLFSIIRLGSRQFIRAALQSFGFSGLIQTAYVERSNLTLRELIAPLSRRTWSLSHDQHHLQLHIHWGLAYYHLARPHLSLRTRVRGPSRHRFRTPAMAAGLTHRRWSVQEILLTPIPEGGWLDPFPVI